MLDGKEIVGKNAEALRLYLGLDDGRCRTFSEVGRIMNLSGERVRQLLLPSKMALNKLTDRVDSDDLKHEETNLNADHKDRGTPSGSRCCLKCAVAGLKILGDQPYPYMKGVLINVVLVGVTFNLCDICGVKVASIPRIADLNKVLTNAILLKPALLSGEEFRFLRAQAEVSPPKLAQHLGVDFATILSWERCSVLRYPNDLAARIVFANLMWPTEERLIVKIVSSIQPRRSKPQLKAFWIDEQTGWTTSWMVLQSSQERQ